MCLRKDQEREQTEELPEGNDDEKETARSGYSCLQSSDKEIVDKDYRGWSFGEIGMNKGMKENTARMRYSRAMKRIRKYIANKVMKKIAAYKNGTRITLSREIKTDFISR